MDEVKGVFGLMIFMGIGLLIYEYWAVVQAILGLFFIGFFVWLLVLIGWAVGSCASKVGSWADDRFVKHPAEPIVEPVLQEGKELNVVALREVLTPKAADLDLTRPLYHYENQAKKAQALTKKLNENARLAEAALRVERKRAELREAQEDLERAKQG
jgi:hypothetical protein